MTEERKITVVPSLIAATMLFFATMELPYGYYRLLRWVICGISVFLAYKSYEMNKITWVWIMGIIAILFNPLIPIHLDKESWMFIDIVAAFTYLASILFIKKKESINCKENGPKDDREADIEVDE
jgi:hypothetical protein